MRRLSPRAYIRVPEIVRFAFSLLNVRQRYRRSAIGEKPLAQAVTPAARKRRDDPDRGERNARQPPAHAILQIALEEGLRRRDQDEHDEAEDPKTEEDSENDQDREGSAVAIAFHHQARAAA